MNRFQWLVAVLVAGVLMTAPASGEGSPSPKVETFRLSNGMEAVVLPDHRAPVVTHMVWYRVGAADDGPGVSGIAHFFEHLMFKATDKIPAGEFSKIVDRNGGRDNAMTSRDYTAYFQRVAKDRLPIMMQMEADRMVGLRLEPEEVLPERDVVKEERRQTTESRPERLLFEKVFAAIYGDHPYAIPIIGKMEEVAALTQDDAEAFYRKWYGPENAILVVAGDITAAELKPLAEQIYGVIPPKGDLHEREWPPVQAIAADTEVVHRDSRVRQPDWSRYWLGVKVGDPQGEALELAAEILGGGRTSRLNRELVETQKLAVSAYAFVETDALARGLIGVGASPAPGVELDAIREAVMAVVDQFVETGPTEEEVRRAKSRLKASVIFARDSQTGMANMFGAQLVRGESVERILGWPDRIDAVSATDIRDALRTYLRGPHHVDARLLEGND